MRNELSFQHISTFTVLGAMLWLCTGYCAKASVVWSEIPDYSSVHNSPWYTRIEAGSVYIEDFFAGPNLSRTFVTPYISSPAGRKGSESGYYSVDGDDGLLDDIGRFGGSYEAGGTQSPDGLTVNFRFDFTRNDSGDLPRSVGLVVTNAIMNKFSPIGNRSIAAAFDSSGGRIGEWVINDMPLSIIQSSLEWHPYHTNGSQFVGVVSDIGIASFTIFGVNHVDHIQYSFDRVPEPDVWMLGLWAVGWYGISRRGRVRADQLRTKCSSPCGPTSAATVALFALAQASVEPAIGVKGL